MAQWVLLVGILLIPARWSLTTPMRVDSNGYEAAAWLVTQGARPYVDFIHSQGPLFLWWGAAWWHLTGGWEQAFRLSALVSYTAAMGLALATLVRAGWERWERLGAMVLLFFCPVALWEGWFFIGHSELILGLVAALYGLLGRERPHWVWIGVGLGVAVSCRLLAVPAAAGILLAAFFRDRRAGVQAGVLMTGLWLVCMGWHWWGGGFDAWWHQAVAYHRNKSVLFVDRWHAYVRNYAFLLPLVVVLVGAWRGQAKQVSAALGLGVAVTMAAGFAQPIFTTHYLVPVLVCGWGVVVAQGAALLEKRRWTWVPVVALGGWQVVSSLLPSEGRAPLTGLPAVCATLQDNVSAGAPVLVESVTAWPVLQCGDYRVWHGLTDTNLMIFQSVVDLNGVAEGLVMDPPAAVVMVRGLGLDGVLPVNAVLDEHYRQVPQPSDSVFAVYLPR